MKKNILLILLPIIFLSSCDYIGTSKIKNLIDLTDKLTIETTKKPIITSAKEDPFIGKRKTSYVNSRNKIISPPIMANGVVYNIDKKGLVTAFSTKERKKLWSSDIARTIKEKSFYGGGMLYNNGKLYVTFGTRYLVILDASTGYEIIRKEFPDILRLKPVSVTKNLILVQTVSNQLFAYNTENFKIAWRHYGNIETVSSKAHAHPVVYNGFIIASYSSGEVFYINAITGQAKWSYMLSTISDVGLPNYDPSVIVTPAIISGNSVYFATSNDKLVRLSLDNGMPLWKKEVADVQTMLLHEGNLFITNNARQTAAISIIDGKVSWIGNLITPKERKKKRPKPVLFQVPYITKNSDSWSLNVIGSNGELYKFTTDINGDLPEDAEIIKINKGVIGYNIDFNNDMYLFTDRRTVFWFTPPVKKSFLSRFGKKENTQSDK
ncbi:MAG: PQQ-binding-like beta-propeller repeat protein [Rickettsiaceae bacterium]|nr:PQQ-binding-like beta-propeller repeat protein [Rickettsiaceae bacterium]